MKKRLTIKIKMEEHLISFLYSVYQPTKTQEALFLPSRDRLNKLLSLLLTRPPSEQTPPEEGTYLELVIPYFEKININSINHISIRAQKTFARSVKKIYTIQFFEFIDDCLISGFEKIDAVNLFIEKYNLPDDLAFQERLLKSIYRSKKIMNKFPPRSYKKLSA